MRNTSEMTDLKYKKAFEMQSLWVKEDRTAEETEMLRILAQDVLSVLPPAEPALPTATIDDFNDDNGFEPNEHPLVDSEERAPAARAVQQIPTIAANLARQTKAGAVEIKQQAREQVGTNVGAIRAPLSNVSNLVENSIFLSPGKTTLHFERRVALSVKKVDGTQFTENLAL